MNTAYTRRYTRWVEDGNNADGFLLNVGRGAQNYLKGGKGDDCANVSADKICITNGYLFDTQIVHDERPLHQRSDDDVEPHQGAVEPVLRGLGLPGPQEQRRRARSEACGRPPGYFWDENTRHTKLSLDYAGSFENDFGADVASTFSWGGQIFKDKHRWTEWDVERLRGPGHADHRRRARRSRTARSTTSRRRAPGFFLQELLGYQDRMFLTGGHARGRQQRVRVELRASGLSEGERVVDPVGLRLVPDGQDRDVQAAGRAGLVR